MSRATQIERIIAKGQLVPLVFMQVTVAATQTDVQLKIAEVNGATDEDAIVIDEYVMPFDGEVVAVSASYSADLTAGTLAAEPTINGTGTALTADLSDTVQRDYSTQIRGSDAFVAGDRIGAEITTSGTFAPVTGDLAVVVWVLLSLEGI